MKHPYSARAPLVGARQDGPPQSLERLFFACRLIVGGILIYAGFIKAVGSTGEFAAAIEAYKLIPAAWIKPFAIGLPYMEMWIGLFLAFGLFTRAAAAFSTLFFAVFFTAVGSALARGIDLATCGCFGADTFSPRYTILIDAIFLGLSIGIFRLAKVFPRYSLDDLLR